jgi:hypothetical protein
MFKINKINLMLVGIMLMAILLFYSSQVQAAMDGDYTYTVTDATAQITGYTGAGGVVTVPSALGGVPVTNIGDDAFVDWTGTGLTSISIPQGITSIGNTAFWGCKGLTTISIPQGVISIGNGAFSSCTGLTSISFNSPTTTIYDDANTIPEATQIIGYEPSTAKDYATKYKRTFHVIGTTVVASTPKPITVIVNGTSVVFDQPPVINNGRTIVPMRAIFEALGVQVNWDGDTQTITATKDTTKIIVKIGNTQATVNGETKTLDVPAQIINNRTMVPVRFISESLGAKVYWAENSQTVTINE